MLEFTAVGPAILALALWDAVAFWGIIFTIFVLICFDQGMISLGVLIAATIASWMLGVWTADLILAHQKAAIWFLVFYVPLGILWATLKWYLYCSKLARNVGKYITEQETAIRNAGNTPERVAQMMADVRDRLWSRFEKLPPLVGNHKGDLIRWMAWWPFSVLSSIFSDLVREFFIAIYNRLGKIWQKISDHAFRNIQYENPPAE